MDNSEYLFALKHIKCHIYEEHLKIYYIATFTLNGKLQFDQYYHSLAVDTEHQVLDIFI